MRATVAIVLALALAPGCSIVYMDPLPDGQPASATPRCTGTRGFAAWDVALALNWGTTAGAILETKGDSTENTIQVVSYIALAVVHLYSAFQGFRRADRCREARSAHDEWLRTHR